MKSRWLLLSVTLFLFMSNNFGQSLSLSPATLSPNIVTITAVNAGEVPSNPMVNNTSQSLVYRFRRTGGWGSSSLGRVDAICWWLPDGITLKVNADNNSGPGQNNGIAAPAVNLGQSFWDWKNFIYNIKTTSEVSRVITMSAEVTDFSALAIGVYDVTVMYRLSY